MSDLNDLYQRLLPTNGTITDIHGNVHAVPTVVPARYAILATREIRALLTMPCQSIKQEGDDVVEMDVARVLGFAEKLNAGGASFEAAKAVAAVIDVSGDSLGRAFAVAFPDLAKLGDPLDLFPLEAVIGALLPLFVRLGGSVLGLAKAVHPEN